MLLLWWDLISPGSRSADVKNTNIIQVYSNYPGVWRYHEEEGLLAGDVVHEIEVLLYNCICLCPVICRCRLGISYVTVMMKVWLHHHVVDCVLQSGIMTKLTIKGQKELGSTSRLELVEFVCPCDVYSSKTCIFRSIHRQTDSQTAGRIMSGFSKQITVGKKKPSQCS